VPRLHHQRPKRKDRQGAETGPAGASVGLDLLRADLYRLLDEVARASDERRSEVVREFERTWEEFRDATERRR
jgi:hypothetical protein